MTSRNFSMWLYVFSNFKCRYSFGDSVRVVIVRAINKVRVFPVSLMTSSYDSRSRDDYGSVSRVDDDVNNHLKKHLSHFLKCLQSDSTVILTQELYTMNELPEETGWLIFSFLKSQ